MTDALFQVNWLAVLAATVAQTLLGGLWFAGLFGAAYARIMGIDAAPNAPRFVVGPLLCSLVTIVATATLLRALGTDTLAGALAVGGVVGAGLVAPTVVNIAINPLFPRPLAYAVLNVPVFVIGSVMTAAILFALS